MNEIQRQVLRAIADTVVPAVERADDAHAEQDQQAEPDPGHLLPVHLDRRAADALDDGAH